MAKIMNIHDGKCGATFYRNRELKLNPMKQGAEA